MQILARSTEIMYTVTPVVLTTLFTVASKSPCSPKKILRHVRNFFPLPLHHLTPLFPPVPCPRTRRVAEAPIMQMHEVKRPGPGHDRSETTPDRVPAAFYSLYRERREGGAWGGLERGKPPRMLFTIMISFPYNSFLFEFFVKRNLCWRESRHSIRSFDSNQPKTKR